MDGVGLQRLAPGCNARGANTFSYLTPSVGIIEGEVYGCWMRGYPMVAPTNASHRSALAKGIGLGRKP